MCGGYDGCSGRALSQSPDDEKHLKQGLPKTEKPNQIRSVQCSAVSAHAM